MMPLANSFVRLAGPADPAQPSSFHIRRYPPIVHTPARDSPLCVHHSLVGRSENSTRFAFVCPGVCQWLVVVVRLLAAIEPIGEQ